MGTTCLGIRTLRILTSESSPSNTLLFIPASSQPKMISGIGVGSPLREEKVTSVWVNTFTGVEVSNHTNDRMPLFASGSREYENEKWYQLFVLITEGGIGGGVKTVEILVGIPASPNVITPVVGSQSTLMIPSAESTPLTLAEDAMGLNQKLTVMLLGMVVGAVATMI